ncbi:pilus assembly protein PilM [Pseudobacteriovorax antillogorgiicola]|uniref:Type II secretion system protein L (GspL) n=1 Tax=Pseudobacteriovorax antillogorgiicola TaxID=1513793 RepID=A0A1Y6BBB8_9BACT|nr:pilus assembly protein PilM [Pseudobacteriovorax antillogorgiicola]TCS58709.1 type II secretion system protein L (GspL) [Pseudobacteriovorax antillogorgiicola]SME95554.1 type II secretion system protein L (GspL) [Pseudobacteriovorax antillogorgiicola]
MQKVIGLDIGSYSIKAVEIVNTFKSYEITNFYETVIPNLEGVPLDAVVPVCMEQLFKEHHLQADRIITAMPGQFISSRVLPFNFSDPRKIEASIAVELEDHVPFNMDDMVLDHQILGAHGGQTMALAVMTRKAFLKNFLDLLSRINIDPKLIDVDSLAFYNLSSNLNMEDEECYALVDVGNEKTSVCIIQNNVLKMFRSINLGGRYITDFLARDLETNFHEAQRIKHRVSRVMYSGDMGDQLDGHERMVAERTTLAANAIVKELGRTFYAFKTWDKHPLSRIIVSGGTSKLQNFDKFLSEQLEVPVERFNLANTDLIVNPELESDQESLLQSLAIGLRAVTNMKKHSQINLRRGEFAYVQNYESMLRGATMAFKVLVALFCVLIVSYALKYYFYQSQINEITEQYKKEFTTKFPDQKRRFNNSKTTFAKLRKDAERKLNDSIMEKQQAISEFRLANSESGALRVLRDISNAIPKDVKIDVTSFEFKTVSPGSGKLILKAETDNFSSQSSILEALNKVNVLSNVEEKQSGRKPGSTEIIEFTVHANYEAI